MFPPSSSQRQNSQDLLRLQALSFQLPEAEVGNVLVREFLERHQAHLGLEAPDVRTWAQTAWPQSIPSTLYVSNAALREGYLDLSFRAACEGPRAERLGAAGFTVAIAASRQHGRLLVRRFELVPHVAPRSYERPVSAVVHWNREDVYVTRDDLDQLGRLPARRAHTEARLEPWREYLAWKRRLVEDAQLSIPYLAWRWSGERTLRFLIDGEQSLPEVKIVGTEIGAAPPAPAEPAEDEDRVRRRREPRPIDLGELVGELAALPEEARGARDDWTGDVTPDWACYFVDVQVDEERAALLQQRPPPAPGRLVSSIGGDLATLDNQIRGIERLRNDSGFSPYLADFMFDARAATVPAMLDPLPDIPGARALNDGQRNAVAKAMSAPDLCLIQGPPGTGKTTVIAELCLRVVSQGGRVLVASQTNLAVDNALSRLADRTELRRLRLGRADRIDEDHRDFLAEYVIERWFSTIAAHCQERIAEAAEREHAAAARCAAATALSVAQREYQQSLERWREEDEAAAARTRELAEARALQERAASAVARDERASSELSALLGWARGESSLPPWSAESPAAAYARPSHGELRDLDVLCRQAEAWPDVDAALADASKADARSGGAVGLEIQALREEKRQLDDAVEDAQLQRLKAINLRLRVLEKEGWASCTKALSRALGRVGAPPSFAGVDLLADALSPPADLLARVEAARAAVAERAAACAAAIDARDALVPAWSQTHERLLASLAGQRAQRDEHFERSRTLERTADAQRVRAAEARRLVDAERQRWDQAWRAIYGDVQPIPPDPSTEALAAVRRYVSEARDAAAPAIERAGRWQSIQSAWCARLAEVKDVDRDHLEQLYLRHANVVGMTCNEAGRKERWQDAKFRPFDLVIVDEVSKATPTELILPMLLGRKTVLVGDHHQLPPMFREREASFAEAVEDGHIDRETFARFRKLVTAGLFEELFEAAAPEIKATLTVQYRMHPQIMDAVNQFYGGRLQAGPDRVVLDRQRQHHLVIPDHEGGRFLEPQQHFLWIDSSYGPDGRPCFEIQDRSSKANELEVELVVATLRSLGLGLVHRGYGRSVELHLGSEDDGRPLRDVAARLAPEGILDELFEERRVRVDGRSVRPAQPARRGGKLVIDARKSVGVITFYGAQLRRLRQAIDRAKHAMPRPFDAIELRTNTVDRFQGMEQPIVVASLVRSSKRPLGDFVREYQRINVGVSRAQQLLVLIAAGESFRRAAVAIPGPAGELTERSVYADIFEVAQTAGGRRLARQLLR